MGTIIFLLFPLCFLAMTSHAFDSPQTYWTSKLPNTPIPQLIEDSLVTPGVGLTLEPSTPRKFLQSANDESTLKTIIEAYIGTYCNKRFLSSISNNHLSHHKKGIGKIESLGRKQLEVREVNDLKESLIPKNFVELYSKQQPEISTNVQLETTVSNDLKESLIPKNLIQLYSKQQPESKETDSLSDSPISTNVQLETMVSNDLKESLISKNFVNVCSKQQPEAMKSSDLRMSSLPNPLTLNSNEQHKRVTMHNHDVSKSEEGELVFVEEDLHVGKTFKLHFRKGEYNNPFLPRDVAVKIPFSSGTLQDTLNLLSVSPNSVQSKVIAEKMALCEEGPIEGLEKQCVTSLESMVDFVVSNLGENVRTVFTKVEQDYPKTEYRVTQVKRLTKNDHETIACHKMEYPYALYFCHGTLTLRPYMVTLLAKDGTEIQAVASCHKETTDPLKNFMKNVLKVMPGSTRICHILTTQDNLFWVIN